MTPEFWLQVSIAVGSAVASALTVYIGIKVDLAVTRAHAMRAIEDANKAHDRLDNHIEKAHA